MPKHAEPTKLLARPGNGNEMRCIEDLEKEAGVEWSNIRHARLAAANLAARLNDALAELAPADTSVVVFGSLARQEVTTGSDIDWTLLVDGQANPQHFDASITIESALFDAIGAKPPGREGTFGGLAFSHDILHKIGGGDDSNKNTTQRILLLLESSPIGAPDAYARLLRGVLKRYIAEDYGLVHRINTVPRFLQNDIARYWRTVAVDFAYKRRERSGSGWALRTVKLRMSRKLTYASGLLVCFAPALKLADDPPGTSIEEGEPLPAVDYLEKWVRLTPLNRLACFSILMPELRTPVSTYFRPMTRSLAC